MSRTRVPWRVLLATILWAGPAVAQDPPPAHAVDSRKEMFSGSDLFKTYCTTCHGASAKGDGVLAAQLRVRPTDLTLLARKNKGKWDGEKVARVIDGRDSVKGHGGTDMPVWGDAFKNSRDGFKEEIVKAKVDALRDYIESLQEPAEKP